jgi:hypothetical protein
MSAGESSQHPCPPWCAGKHELGEIHRSVLSPVQISGAGGRFYDSGTVTVEINHAFGDFIDAGGEPATATVNLNAPGNTGSVGFTIMTPAEAVALAEALARAAWRAQPAAAPAGDPDACPPWCEITSAHEDTDGGEMRHALCEALQLSGYPYDVQGTRYHHSLLATRKQVRNGEPVILIENPDDDADDPDKIIEVPGRQVMISTGEAVELAVTLLDLVIGPEALLAARAGWAGI